MDRKNKQDIREREIIEEIVKLLSSMEARKINAVYRFVLGIK